MLESNKKDKTTETDPSDNFVTVAASRIFNRSGKTQIIKKMCMKTILDEVFEDTDTVPYISIDKIEEKKKKSNIFLLFNYSYTKNKTKFIKKKKLILKDIIFY